MSTFILPAAHQDERMRRIRECLKEMNTPIPDDWKKLLETPPFGQEEVAVDPAENQLTLVHLTYTTNPKYDSGWWVRIHPQTFLFNPVTCDRLELQSAINIPYAPKKAYLKKKGDQLHFTLIFNAIPEDWETFHLVEPGKGDTFVLENFKRNAGGVYHRNIF
jgi:hypothetical protein